MVAEEQYPPEQVEELLQAGELAQAFELGWFGDEWSYRVVRAATLPRIAVSVASASSDLGLDLRNDDGVATVGFIVPGSVCDGKLQRGDVIRTVDGTLTFTCEAAVRAIKAWRRRSAPGRAHTGPALTLEAVRPPVVQLWRDELSLAAGAHGQLRFETAFPACLTYWFQSATGYDVGMSVVRLDGREKARKTRSAPQTALLDLKAHRGRGHLVLSDGGCYAVMFDNRHSVLRSKTVRYTLRCVPLDAWEAGRQVERLAQLETECARRKAKAKELTARVHAPLLPYSTLRPSARALLLSIRPSFRVRDVRWAHARRTSRRRDRSSPRRRRRRSARARRRRRTRRAGQRRERRGMSSSAKCTKGRARPGRPPPPQARRLSRRCTVDDSMRTLRSYVALSRDPLDRYTVR